jgi:plasmid stability protein
LATLVIRNVEASLHARLKSVAAAHGLSMEEEARQVLRQALAPAGTGNTAGFGDAMRGLFEPIGGIDLPDIGREPLGAPPDFTATHWDADRPR